MPTCSNEVKGLAESGFQEVVLTGIHLSSYGIDNGGSLLELILKTMEVPGIRRVRLGSLEPRIITEEFVNALKDQEKFCPHFHLSLQSGCDATLKRMNRRYTAEEYYEKCVLLRENFDHPALTTDVIVGFPGVRLRRNLQRLWLSSRKWPSTRHTFSNIPDEKEPRPPSWKIRFQRAQDEAERYPPEAG